MSVTSSLDVIYKSFKDLCLLKELYALIIAGAIRLQS
jgi:hypothetical protein